MKVRTITANMIFAMSTFAISQICAQKRQGDEYRKTKIEIKFCISIFKFFQVFLSKMDESENHHCEHDIRNEHVRYSTNLSTKTPRGRISKNENRKKNSVSIFKFFQVFFCRWVKVRTSTAKMIFSMSTFA